jgi:hypothetical protein
MEAEISNLIRSNWTVSLLSPDIDNVVMSHANVNCKSFLINYVGNVFCS